MSTQPATTAHRPHRSVAREAGVTYDSRPDTSGDVEAHALGHGAADVQPHTPGHVLADVEAHMPGDGAADVQAHTPRAEPDVEPHPPGVEAEVDLEPLEGAIDALACIDVDQVHPEALGQLLSRLTRLSDRLDAVRAGFLAGFDRREAFKLDGKRTAAAWLAERLQRSPCDARAQVRLAQNLDSLPATKQAFEDGRISAAHAKIVVRFVDHPSTAEGQELESELATRAVELDPRGLARLARNHTIQDQPEAAAAKARRQWDERRAHRRQLADGTVHHEIVSDPASAEFIDAAIARLCKPDPKDLPDDQRRSFTQRQHDAFIELAKLALDRDELPAKHGPSTVGLVTVPLATLVHGDGQGRRPAELAFNGPIDAATAQAMCCDARLARVIFDGESQILDLGRTSRVCSDEQRAAVYARDRGCRRCGAPVAFCEVHHLWPWDDDGPTDLCNLIALCWACHREIHAHRWTIVLHPDNTVTFQRADGQQFRRPPP